MTSYTTSWRFILRYDMWPMLSVTAIIMRSTCQHPVSLTGPIMYKCHWPSKAVEWWRLARRMGSAETLIETEREGLRRGLAGSGTVGAAADTSCQTSIRWSNVKSSAKTKPRFNTLNRRSPLTRQQSARITLQMLQHRENWWCYNRLQFLLPSPLFREHEAVGRRRDSHLHNSGKT